ncbi:hypothetical protein NQ317_003007 [Molorchus minor]|uniref:Uncharacterized protein n=1 Tax=Molorchus minor TaxID=1323400 RepID=A0ABQ9JL65_9CUCU|nr:hypothetical protein NQ317_003007 [Molorchus minor]
MDMDVLFSSSSSEDDEIDNDLEMVIKCLICKAPFKQGENRSFHRLGFASSGNSNDSSKKLYFRETCNKK